MQKKVSKKSKNAYQILQFDPHISAKDIRKAYNAWKKRKLTGAGGEEEKRRREEEGEALKILETKRAKYDEALKLTRKRLLEKIKKHCYDTEQDPSSITGSEYEELDTEELRRIYIFYPDSHHLIDNLPDDAPELPKGHCNEERTLISILKAHLNRDSQGRSLAWQHPISKRAFTQELAREIADTMIVRNTELLSAVEANDIEQIKKAIENGADPDKINSKSTKTPLLNYAILKSRDISTIRTLLEYGVKANNSDIRGFTTLMCVKGYEHNKRELLDLLKEFGSDPSLQLVWAIKGNNTPGVISLLTEFGAEINKVVEHLTPLMHAIAMSSSLHVIEKLLEHGANIHSVDRNNSPVLFGVPFYSGNRIALLRLLIRHGANLHHTDDHGRDVLYWTLRRTNDITFIEELLNQGVSVTRTYDATNDRGFSVLTLAIRQHQNLNVLDMLISKDPTLINKYGPNGPPIVMALAMQSVNLFQWCINHGADVNIQDRDQHKSLLMHGVLSDTEAMVTALISKGVNMNMVDAKGNTALHYASRVGNIRIVRLLINGGANKDAKNGEGNTPLHTAISHHKLNVAEYLIQEGARTLLRNTHGYMPIHLCLSPDRQELFHTLWDIYKGSTKKENYDKKLLLIACQSPIPEVVMELINSGVDASYIDEQTGASTLIYATTTQYDTAILNMLITHGADIHKVDIEGRNALMYAVLADHEEAFDFLLQKGADLKQKDADGSSILHLASGVRDARIVKKLMEAGCDPNDQNNDKNTPLLLATDLLNVAVMKVLLESGADPNVKNKQRHTAIFYVVEKADDPHAQACVDILRKHGATMTDTVRTQLEEQGITVHSIQSAGKRKTNKK